MHQDFIMDMGWTHKVSPFPEELLVINSCLERDVIFFRYIANYSTPPPMMGQEISFNLLDHIQKKTGKQDWTCLEESS